MHAQTDLGHNNIFTSEPVIRVRVVEIHIWDRDRSVRADVFHSGHFGFGFASRHKPAGDTGDDDTAIA